MCDSKDFTPHNPQHSSRRQPLGHFRARSLGPPQKATRAKAAACRESPHPECLLDLGVALLLDQRELTSSNSWLANFAMSGRIDDAEAVFRGLAERSGASPDDAAKSARRVTGRYRLATELRAGIILDAALATLPEVDGSDLWLVGLDLLGRRPFGRPASFASEAPGDAERELVAALATRILAWNRSSPQRAQDYHLEYAAKLRAALGDRDGTVEVLREMSTRDLPGHMWLSGLSVELLQVVGPDAALALADPLDRTFPTLLLRAGSAEQDPTKAAEHLAGAFEIHASRSPWPDFNLMLRVVKAAADRGLAQETRVFADRVVELAESYAEAPFGVFHGLDAAEALHLADAASDEVSQQISLAVSQFPESGSEAVALGLVSGPMLWESSGLADEARGVVAAISAEIGDHETSVRMLGRLSEPVPQWLYLMDRNLSVATLDVLHEAVWRLLAPEDAAYVTGQFARMFVMHERTFARKAWALRIARELAADTDALRARSGAVATAVALVAFDQQDVALGRAALEALARLALDRHDAALLIRAGYMMISSQS